MLYSQDPTRGPQKHTFSTKGFLKAFKSSQKLRRAVRGYEGPTLRMCFSGSGNLGSNNKKELWGLRLLRKSLRGYVHLASHRACSEPGFHVLIHTYPVMLSRPLHKKQPPIKIRDCELSNKLATCLYVRPKDSAGWSGTQTWRQGLGA